MTDRSKQHFDENDIPRLVRELPTVEADGDFRERLRSAFAEGRMETSRPEDRESSEEKPRFFWWRWMVPATAAAVLLVTIMTLNRAPDLRVSQVTGQGEAQVDGRSIALEDIDALTAAIRAGSEIETPPGALIDLLAEDVVLFEITGGTRMSIPAMPGRWFGREVSCSLFVGELRIKTGKRFPGSEFLVYTPEGIVEIAGTLLSVQRDEGGTCVCVLEGIAHVGVDPDDMQPVKPGYRKVMMRDGTVEIIPVKPMHRDGVLDFDKRVGHQIE
jgi:ferric-dicitrate binding protein FerR (iron transport regulator)